MDVNEFNGDKRIFEGRHGIPHQIKIIARIIIRIFLKSSFFSLNAPKAVHSLKIQFKSW